MTVNVHAARHDYTANGSVSDFPFTFPIYTKADLAVYVNGSLQALDTHYHVRSGSLPFEGLTSSQLPSTGFVRFISSAGGAEPPAAGAQITILRNQTVQQTTDYQPNTSFPATRLEKDFDKIIMILQQTLEVLGRAPRFGTASLLKDKVIPEPAGVNQAFGFDGNREPTLFNLSALAVEGVENPMSAVGDLLVGGAAGAPARLPVGAATTYLRSDGTEPAWAFLSLSDVGGGTLAAGTVPLPRMQRTEDSAVGSGGVSVTSSLTELVSLPISGNVVIGDRLLVVANVPIVKGETAGATQVRLDKGAGTAVVAFGHDLTTFDVVRSVHEASTTEQVGFSVMAKVTTGGSLTLRLQAASSGSDSSVDGTLANLYALVLRGS